MHLKKLGIRASGAMLALFFIATLQADTIGPSCGSCFGATYTLSNLGLQSSGGGNETWRIEYDINTTGYTGASTDYIQSVAVKVSSMASAVSLFSHPAGTWTLFLGGLDNGNCNGKGSGFVCAQDGTSAVANGSTYTWIFDITLPSGTLLTGTNQASIKANYNPPNGMIVSEDITLGGVVPEPATITLLGGGLLAFAAFLRRRVAA